MSGTMVQTTTTTEDSFKEAVQNRHTQPGLEAVFLQGPGFGYPVQGGYGHGHGHSQPPVQQGIGKKKLFWLWVALGVLVAAVIGLSVGLGVGLAKMNGSGSESEAASSQSSPTDTDNDTSPNNATSPAAPSTSSSSSSSSLSSSPTTTPTATYTSPFDTDSGPDATITLSGVHETPNPSPTSICPTANNTVVVQLPGPKRYRIFCDSDFGSSGGKKKDLASVVLGSFDACLELCNTMNYFQEREDVGCTYNVEGTGEQTPGTCWCLGGSLDVVTNVGNEVAVPID